ncbi:MAG: LysR family transcriptional regulator [Caulobacter sp.]|nr:LysR family transcriptional regulator [Caulobacter sp.]
MRRQLPPLSTLRAFEAVARLGSVGGAAAELGRTHGAVSKQIRALQLEAGIPLFEKAGTGLRANAEGRRLAQAVGLAFDGLADRYSEIVGEARAPTVHIACSATFAMGWLTPRLPLFARRHPEIRIRLSMTSAREMRDEREADLTILWDRDGYPAADRARAVRLADTAFALVAAPGYPIDRSGETLATGCRILHDHTSSAWARWEAGSGLRVIAEQTLSFPHTHLCLAVAAAGMGVAVAERRLTEADIAAGRLVRVSDFVNFADGFAVLPHRQRALSPASERFVAWLAAELEAGD